MDAYKPKEVETRWQARWLEERLFRAGRFPERPKFYQLEMFPYPSGRLHMGHMRNYSIGDVIARFHWMRGRDVLHPIGWDAFGMPAENAALDSGKHPSEWTYANIRHMRTQLQRLGFSFDWDREIATCRPEYYRWEQLVFLKMLEKGLAYKKKATVNWCPKDETVLANEQVVDGGCWRCGTAVISRDIEQWFFRITQYAEELLADLEKLEGKWPERVLTMQRNWIGKSQGAHVTFSLEKSAPDGTKAIQIFTTRPDTLFGATFMSLAAEHPLALQLARQAGKEKEAAAFIEKVKAQGRRDPEAGEVEKEGVFTGAYCLNPFTGWKMPIWIANFVLMEYGTGAVMAVPSHDQRDFEFAKKYGQRIVVVIEPEGKTLDGETMTEAWEGPGTMTNSGEFDGLQNEEGKKKIVAHLEKKGIGQGAITYRLRDWLISRQRYWGTPIPVVYTEDGKLRPVDAKTLPIELPMDVEITGEGGSPLERHAGFAKSAGPGLRRDTDTMDTFVESSWYFLRYLSARNTERIVDPKDVRRWMPVDQYVGGVEHAVLHLLYARFFTKVLRDLDLVPGDLDEPFSALLTQGMVCKESYFRGAGAERKFFSPEEVEVRGDGTPVLKADGKPVEIGRNEKMSKSKKNGVDPDNLIEKYGADTARLFCLFAAPPERDLLWDDTAVEGCWRFLGRLWRLVAERPWLKGVKPSDEGVQEGPAAEVKRQLHKTIKAVTEDCDPARFRFNTAIARMQELVNALYKFEVTEQGPETDRALLRRTLDVLCQLLHPFCPHITEELWHELGNEEFLLNTAWPAFDPAWVKEDSVTIAVQVKGKVRATIEVPRDSAEEAVKELALADEKVQKHLEGKPLRKVIFVPNRILNLVV